MEYIIWYAEAYLIFIGFFTILTLNIQWFDMKVTKKERIYRTIVATIMFLGFMAIVGYFLAHDLSWGIVTLILWAILSALTWNYLIDRRI